MLYCCWDAQWHERRSSEDLLHIGYPKKPTKEGVWKTQSWESWSTLCIGGEQYRKAHMNLAAVYELIVFLQNVEGEEIREQIPLNSWAKDQIRQYDPLAANYLSYMSCIDPKNIPQSLLPPGRSRTEEVKAIGTLKAYSFIIRRPTDLALDMHRLVHLATRNGVCYSYYAYFRTVLRNFLVFLR